MNIRKRKRQRSLQLVSRKILDGCQSRKLSRDLDSTHAVALLLIVAFLTLAAPPRTIAQQEVDADAATATTTSAASSESETPEPITASADQKESELDDYEASEQISEDLSVSFPVDI